MSKPKTQASRIKTKFWSPNRKALDVSQDVEKIPTNNRYKPPPKRAASKVPSGILSIARHPIVQTQLQQSEHGQESKSTSDVASTDDKLPLASEKSLQKQNESKTALKRYPSEGELALQVHDEPTSPLTSRTLVSGQSKLSSHSLDALPIPTTKHAQSSDKDVNFSHNLREPRVAHMSTNFEELHRDHETMSSGLALPPEPQTAYDLDALERGANLTPPAAAPADNYLETSSLLPENHANTYASIHPGGTASAPPCSPAMLLSPPPQSPLGDGQQGQTPCAGTFWGLYYQHQTIFYCLLTLIMIMATVYTLITGKGFRYYSIIMRASICLLLGSDAARSLFGDSFCDFHSDASKESLP